MFKSIALKFFGVLLVVLLLTFLLFGLWIDHLVKNMQIERSKTVVANFIQLHARKFLEPQSFVFASNQASRERFTYFFNIVRTSEIVRIKVWDAQSRVIFSDDESIIGEKFPENEELRESLKGQIEAEIQKPVKAENAGETQYSQLLEVYVPIYFEQNERPAGVVETYFSLDEVNTLLFRIRLLIFTAMLFLIVSVFMSVWLLFWILVKKRLAMLVQASHKIAQGELEMSVAVKGQDEIGELATAFNLMAAKLKELYEGLEQKVRDRTQDLEKDNKLMIGRELKMVELKKEIENLKKRIKNGLPARLDSAKRAGKAANGNHKND